MIRFHLITRVIIISLYVFDFVELNFIPFPLVKSTRSYKICGRQNEKVLPELEEVWIIIQKEVFS